MDPWNRKALTAILVMIAVGVAFGAGWALHTDDGSDEDVHEDVQAYYTVASTVSGGICIECTQPVDSDAHLVVYELDDNSGRTAVYDGVWYGHGDRSYVSVTIEPSGTYSTTNALLRWAGALQVYIDDVRVR